MAQKASNVPEREVMIPNITGIFYPDKQRIEWECPKCNYRKGAFIGGVMPPLTIRSFCENCNTEFTVYVGFDRRAE